MRTLLVILALWLIVIPTTAQDSTPESTETEYAFTFPLPLPNADQIDEAYACVLDGSDSGENLSEACALAVDLISKAQARGDAPPTRAEIETLTQMIKVNPALPLRTPFLSAFFSQFSLIAPPDVASQPITDVHLIYGWSGMGASVNYDLLITNADSTPVISGEISSAQNTFIGTHTPPVTPSDALVLPDTVNSALIQALAPALTDLFPIGEQFSSTDCWDNYPDWNVRLTFADGSTLEIVTNGSNVIGIGGPWQVEIDGQDYMQYSAAFAIAVVDVLDALNLPLGEPAAWGCGGITDPLSIAFPR